MSKSLGQYSIKDLEQLSSVKAHTIRIWEQRYKLLTPKRTATNIRYYDDDQLKKILNVAILLNNGVKISKISKLTEKEINNYILSFSQQSIENTIDEKIKSLIVSMIELNEELFNKVFSSSVLQIGMEETIKKLIYPFLSKVGILWSISEINPAQEHFISNLIRQKIIASTDALVISKKTKNKYLLFLPESELHEIGLLISNYIIKQKGHQTIYLGQNVPLKDLEMVYNIYQPKCILFFITTPKLQGEIEDILGFITKKFAKSTIYTSGNRQLFPQKLPKSIVWLDSIDALKSLI